MLKRTQELSSLILKETKQKHNRIRNIDFRIDTYKKEECNRLS